LGVLGANYMKLYVIPLVCILTTGCMQEELGPLDRASPMEELSPWDDEEQTEHILVAESAIPALQIDCSVTRALSLYDPTTEMGCVAHVNGKKVDLSEVSEDWQWRIETRREEIVITEEEMDGERWHVLYTFSEDPSATNIQTLESFVRLTYLPTGHSKARQIGKNLSLRTAMPLSD